MPKAQDFHQELEIILRDAQNKGLPYIDINSGDLHRRVGGYPGPNHRMPTCCNVLRQYLNNNDKVIQELPSGKGASLTIRFTFPR